MLGVFGPQRRSGSPATAGDDTDVSRSGVARPICTGRVSAEGSRLYESAEVGCRDHRNQPRAVRRQHRHLRRRSVSVLAQEQHFTEPDPAADCRTHSAARNGISPLFHPRARNPRRASLSRANQRRVGRLPLRRPGVPVALNGTQYLQPAGSNDMSRALVTIELGSPIDLSPGERQPPDEPDALRPMSSWTSPRR